MKRIAGLARRKTGVSITGALDEILKRARRRHIFNLLLHQAGIAFSAGAIGVLVLLLVGTQILDWQWPVLLSIAVFAFGAYRVSRKLLPPYRVAQKLDHLLGLDDRLSTVFFFRNLAPSAPALVEVVERQAADRVRPADVDRAMPLSFPRSGYPAVALLTAAVVTFGVRYGVLKTFDLQKPIARINFDTFQNPPKVEAASNRKSAIQEHLEKQLQQMSLTLDQQQDVDKEGQIPTSTNVEAVANEPGGNEKGTPGNGPNPASEGAESKDGDSKSPGDQPGDGKEQNASDGSANQKPQAQQNAKNANGGKNAGGNPGVMDKMKDALANLLNKLGATPQEKGEQSAANQNQQKGGGQQQTGQKGSQGQGKAQGESQQSPDPDSQSDSEGGDKSTGQQKAQGKEANQPAGENAKSGMGKQDGEKAIRDAEQVRAMGKISEIFGKRAAEMQGEMSVEVPSGKQQLKTAYSRNTVVHNGAVVESNRNEVPLIYQTYVQRYFEEVRKTAKPKPATP